jgi:glycosyltransferase involved in cell wall biosynthesis
MPVDARPTLSVIIITFNESRHIGPCLDSVAFADERIVVDSGSTDDTCAIARARGAQVHITADWPGFGAQKNRALDLASGDWVLSLDADERVPADLAGEIRAALAAPGFAAYCMPRLSEVMGRPMRHGGWWPDHVLRLFRRGSARFSNDVVHERVEAEGEPGVLSGHLLHYAYDSIEAMLAKMDRYSTDGALMLHRRGKRTTALGALGHGLWTFIRMYFLRRGFLDGWQGLVVASTGAGGSYFRYLKLLALQRKAP